MYKLNFARKKRRILHIDADAFFVSVEQVINPELRGKPVLVGGHNDGQGIVSSASYEARKFGIKSAMPMYLAKKKCPHAIVVSGHFNVYRDFSQRMFEVFHEFTPHVQMSSIDEAYLDITGFENVYKKSSRLIAKSLLMEVYKRVGLSLSCGLSSNKVVAKVASSIHKPHKLTVVPFGKEREFLAPLPLRALPGIGPRTFDLLQSHGFEKLGDVAGMGLNEVLKRFGVRGIAFWKRAQGFDDSPVIAARPLPKSISKEHTFYQHSFNQVRYLQYLKDLGEIVFAKLRRYKMKARTVFVKLRYKKDRAEGGRRFEDFVYQKNLSVLSSADNRLFAVGRQLFLENIREGEAIRLLGIGVTNIRQNYNLSLFGSENKDDQLFMAIDTVKNLYGEESISYGT